ncbi:flagellar basal body-associated protein FliL [Actimicrobium sp. CCC2.4]|uniref:flagellar basal body-associated protein FliL n=1 Tax=Actimicrobium sp. CCC2.4 TaxID=3048606 RepID=UPI002AC8BAD7|nr:flagellar basal body-associated protein FliL [Actimicrobium sp. CCC2.4]MEB0135233.1 flagellar basal body-associated protein FliL [Actimicrobium sp. CCC2.4]WPX31027.1 flagellar basal body-associated protein FliL [Actimicrobium sp. CCC2.4]
MATAPKPAAPAAADDATGGKKKSKLKLIIIAVVVLALAGGGAGYFLMGKKAKPAGEHAEEPHEVAKAPVFLVLDPFTVNLQQEAGDQYLQIAMTVQVADDKQSEEIKVYLPQIRSRVLMVLSSKKASEINTPDGKKELADDIIAAIKKPFSERGKAQKVNDVFFTSFVIQ